MNISINSLPLDCLRIIAKYDIESYRALLTIRSFGLDTIGTRNVIYRRHFITISTDCYGTVYKLNGMLHREDDFPALLWSNGAREWYRFGKIHRDNDEPAFINDCCRVWMVNGKRHRITGPAFTDKSGSKNWYLNGEQLTEEEHHYRVKNRYYTSLPSITSLPLDCLRNIAEYDLASYRAMLTIRTFALDTINGENVKYRRHFTIERITSHVTFYLLNNMLHRDDDLPAIISPTYTKWYMYGKPHRDDDKPAVIHADGTMCWYRNGIRHRDGGNPALLSPDGRHTWYKNGKLHRDNDQPAHIGQYGVPSWYQNGLLHRDDDKPAEYTIDYDIVHRMTPGNPEDILPLEILERCCNKKWYRKGKLHRANGLPAIVNIRGRHEYYVDGALIYIHYG